MILGLDISTTIIGVAILDKGRLIHCEGWDLSKCSSFYEKVELVGANLYTIRHEFDIQEIFIETALKGFCQASLGLILSLS